MKQMEKHSLAQFVGGIFLILILLILTFTVASAASSPAPVQKTISPPAPTKLPKVISICSYSSGADGYIATSGIREAIEKLTPMKMRVEPYGTDPARILPVKLGQSEGALVTWGTGYPVSRGLFEFSKEEWGPQPLRLIWNVGAVTGGMGIRRDAGIKDWSDLKGKKVGFIPGGTAVNVQTEAWLAFAGLTWGDVKKIDFPSYSQGMKGLAEGAVDAVLMSAAAPAAYEAAASSYGLIRLNGDIKNVEGWKRAHKVMPWLLPIWTTGGPVYKDTPMWGGGYPYIFFTYPNVEADIVFEIVKAIHKGYDFTKDMHHLLKEGTIEFNLGPVGGKTPEEYIPFHEGAVKYFKSIGVWTKELQEWQEKQIREEKARMEGWKAKKK